MAPLKIFLTTWNTNLQSAKAQPQDLSRWLLPALSPTGNDPELPNGVIPDLYAIAVQELLPVHLARTSTTKDGFIDLSQWPDLHIRSSSRSPTAYSHYSPPTHSRSPRVKRPNSTPSCLESHMEAMRFGYSHESRRWRVDWASR